MVSFQEKKIKNFFYQNTIYYTTTINFFYHFLKIILLLKNSSIYLDFVRYWKIIITNFYTSSDSVLNTNEISILSAIITFASSHCDTCVFHTVQFGCPFRFFLYIYIYHRAGNCNRARGQSISRNNSIKNPCRRSGTGETRSFSALSSLQPHQCPKAAKNSLLQRLSGITGV